MGAAHTTGKCNRWTKTNYLPEDQDEFQQISLYPDNQPLFSGRNKDRHAFFNVTSDLKEYKPRGARSMRRDHETPKQLTETPKPNKRSYSAQSSSFSNTST